MSFGNTMYGVSLDLINQFGNSIVLQEVTQGAYDPNNGMTSKVTTEHSTKGVFDVYSSNDYISGAINIDDVRVMVSTPLVVTKLWNIIYQNNIWNIINVSKTTATDDLIYYDFQIRNSGEPYTPIVYLYPGSVYPGSNYPSYNTI